MKEDHDDLRNTAHDDCNWIREKDGRSYWQRKAAKRQGAYDAACDMMDMTTRYWDGDKYVYPEARKLEHAPNCSGWTQAGDTYCECGAFLKSSKLPTKLWKALDEAWDKTPGKETPPKTEKALAEKAAKAPIAGGVLQLFPRAMYHLALTSKAGADKYGTTVSTIKFLDTPGAYELHTDAMIRHVVDEKLEGPVSHKDGGLLHPVMVAWNALARLEVFLKNAEEPDAE